MFQNTPQANVARLPNLIVWNEFLNCSWEHSDGWACLGRHSLTSKSCFVLLENHARAWITQALSWLQGARVCTRLWFLKIRAPHQQPQGTCTNINMEDKSLFHDVNVNLLLPLWPVEYQEPRIIWQEQAGGRQSRQWGERLSLWLRLLLAHSLIVRQSELILFSVLWVKIKLHGLRKEHNSSRSQAWVSVF